MQYINLDETRGYPALQRSTAYNLKQLDRERIHASTIESSNVLAYNWAAKAVDSRIISILADIVDEQDLLGQYRKLVQGVQMNTGEKRSVGHHLTRLSDSDIGSTEAVIRARKYRIEQTRAMRFADDLRSGDIRGAGGKRFDTVLHIGIGGSALGPELICNALRNADSAVSEQENPITFFLVSNVDPDEVAEAVQRCNPETTLILVVSKSGTTQETLSNLNAVQEMFTGAIHRKHQVVAITSESSPLAVSDEFLDVFCIDNAIGGRYSITSTIGALVISLLYGSRTYQEFLVGAAESDRNAFVRDIEKNASLMDAMIGVYERLSYPATAIIPYSCGLGRLPAYLQQLDMESNGKRVNRRGEVLPYATGPMIFGEPGTDSQHSFFQWLHQGTDTIPIQFIGFCNSQIGKDVSFEGSSGLDKLHANMIAQIVAFARGKDNEITSKEFPGQRPSSLLFGPVLNARSLGAIIAHFENKIMFQGFAWNINSFDQEGVQLGKVLTGQILQQAGKDPVLDAYVALLQHVTNNGK